jgi:hypothetical protein
MGPESETGSRSAAMLLESRLRRYAEWAIRCCVQYFSSRHLEGYGSAFPLTDRWGRLPARVRDVWIAIAITTGVGIGVSALIVGLSAIQG